MLSHKFIAFLAKLRITRCYRSISSPFPIIVLVPLLLLFELLAQRPFAVIAQGTDNSGDNRNTNIFLPTILSTCNCFYVDNENGSDNNSGRSTDQAWKSLEHVNSTQFPPGSTIYFKRDSSWTGELSITSSGTMAQPIVFTAYGLGDDPTISNPGDEVNWSASIKLSADWVIIQHFRINNTHDEGILITDGSDYDTIQDSEITGSGKGISIHGQFAKITGNYIHDLHMIRNTPGGNDDFGAIGIQISGSNNEISYNRIVNCKAQSYDYGSDGGAFEWWGTANGNYVHHNWAINNNGFSEIGGGSARNNRVIYNVSINNGVFATLHLNDTFKSYVENFVVENNTIVENLDTKGWVIFNFDGNPTPNTFVAINNIIYATHLIAVANKPNFTHNNNLYYLGGGTRTNFILNPGEIVGDPYFANLENLDFHLMPSSPAINAGQNLGYETDFDDNPLLVDKKVDLGAFNNQD